MQVFLPFFDFRLVTLCLDNKRLNKQLVEAYQIITKRLSYTHEASCCAFVGTVFGNTC